VLRAVTNTCDAFHRLVERATASGKTRFVYDHRWRVIAEYDGNDALVNRYVYGPEIDEPVRLTRGAGRFYYHQAALGTVTELTGWLGHVRERYEYDVYGQPTLRNNVGTEIASSQFGNRFLFQGRDRDPDTGLYNFRYRTYSPTLGRFLQVDPIRERGGWNFYVSFNNCPASVVDYLGLLGYHGTPSNWPTRCRRICLERHYEAAGFESPSDCANSYMGDMTGWITASGAGASLYELGVLLWGPAGAAGPVGVAAGTTIGVGAFLQWLVFYDTCNACVRWGKK
jgi:RHS repeat-associated protein